MFCRKDGIYHLCTSFGSDCDIIYDVLLALAIISELQRFTSLFNPVIYVYI